jgi:hypothetical protein
MVGLVVKVEKSLSWENRSEYGVFYHRPSVCAILFVSRVIASLFDTCQNSGSGTDSCGKTRQFSLFLHISDAQTLQMTVFGTVNDFEAIALWIRSFDRR